MRDLGYMSENRSKNLPDWLRAYLTLEDIDAIESKISDIERSTSGELVLLITRRSFNWRLHDPLVALSALLLFMIFGEDQLVNWIESQFFVTSTLGELGLKLSFVMVILLFAYYFSKIGFMARLFMPQYIRRAMAELRAELEFYRSGIKKTKAATGILLYLAIDDRQAVVLADHAIAKILPADTWDHLLEEMVKCIKSRRAREGILKAIEMSGAILKEHFPIESGDTNELQNHVIIKD